MAEKNSSSFVSKIFVGPYGHRSGWRLLIFNAVFFVLTGAGALAARRIYGPSEPEWTAPIFLIARAASLLIALIFGFSNTGNKGLPVPKHFFDSKIQGPQWLTGGLMGAEAGMFIFPVILILFLAFHLRFKGVRFPSIRENVKT